MKQKILSVVVPTYNMEDYLPRCLDSVTCEDVPDTLEVIVVNDGSKDRSLEIAKEYQAKRPDIISIIDKPNGHYGSCINAALKVATGKYFRPLDADDWFDTEALIELLNKLSLINSDLIITNRICHRLMRKQISYLEKLEYNKEYLLDNNNIPEKNSDLLAMHCMTWKTNYLKEINLILSEGICFTDLEYIFYPTLKANTVIFFDIKLYNYDMTRDGQSMDVKVFTRIHTHMYTIISKILQQKEPMQNLQKSFIFGFCKMYYYRILFCTHVNDELKVLDKILSEKFPNIQKRINRELLYAPSIWRLTNCHFVFYEKLKKIFKIDR